MQSTAGDLAVHSADTDDWQIDGAAQVVAVHCGTHDVVTTPLTMSQMRLLRMLCPPQAADRIAEQVSEGRSPEDTLALRRIVATQLWHLMVTGLAVVALPGVLGHPKPT